MATSTLPLYPSDDGWPYPDGIAELADDDEVDLDALELRADPHAFADLTELEYYVITHRYGIANGSETNTDVSGPSATGPTSMKELARDLQCTHAEVAAVLGAALDKLRTRLTSQ